MATSIQQRGLKHQLRVKHRLLPRPFFWTFPTEGEAQDYRDQLLALLSRGVVPAGMLARPAAQEDPLLIEIIRGYEASASVTDSDSALLGLLLGEVVAMRASDLTYAWVEQYVRRLKTTRNLTPGTIRKRVGTLARVMDWHLKQVTPKGTMMPSNPLRLLPRGYSQYSSAEALLLSEDQDVKVDVSRDRRMLPAEEQRVRLTLSGTKRGDRERPWGPDPEMALLFELIVDTGMRLREAYRVRVEQIDVERGVVRLEGSKATRGQRKPRVVPLKKHLRARLGAWRKGRSSGLLFSFWDGETSSLRNTTNRLSARFNSLFAYADVQDFTEHDLRHEATCRWFELRTPKGGWVYSEIEVCRIMGWTDPKMALKYASLRGEDLADRLL